MTRRAILQLMLAFVVVLTNHSSAAAIQSDEEVVFNKVRLAGIEGDIRPLGQLLEKHKDGSPELRKLVAGFNSRFISRDEEFEGSGNTLVDDVARDFRAYWVSVLMGESDQRQAQFQLFRDLNKTLRRNEHSTAFDPVKKLRGILEEKGFHVLGGTTAPFRELMIWKTQDEKRLNVELTDGKQDVTVVLLDDFFVSGWLDFATLGVTGAAGWAKKDKLFCVASMYDLDSETYRVSYLKHEARHFADYRLFPHATGAELEYRAKLTELAFANSTSGALLEKFRVESSAIAKTPHGQANYRVISSLSKALLKSEFEADPVKWSAIETEQIRQAARVLLLESDAELTAHK